MASGVFSIRQQAQAAGHGAWTGSQTTPFVEYLVVAGGGSGGFADGGGGGAGGLLQGILPFTNGSSITVTVGAGGTVNASYGGAGNNGSNSVFGSITSIGGGGGAGYTNPSKSGGSGGGGSASYNPANLPSSNGLSGQGNAGGNGQQSPINASGGGGGAGTVGINYISGNIGGNGGAGIASSISGSVVVYAGGGAGSGAASGGIGGVGGGGNGGYGVSGVSTGGAVNTGSGGGGDWNGVSTAGAGGSGIVIISYPDIYNAPASFGGANSPTASTSGSGSLSLNGSTQYLSIPTNSVFAFGTGDFTLEAFIYTNSSSAQYIISLNKGAGPECSLYLTSGVLTYYDATAGTKSSGVTPSLNAWHHVAVCRASGVIYFYVDGVQSGSTFSVTTSIVNTSDSYFGGSSGGADFSGYATNFRVVKGVAVYTGSFTALTSPLTATQKSGTNISAITGTQTSALLNIVSGSQFADSSTNSFAPSAFGSPAWNQLSPFATGLGYKNRVYTWTGSGTVTF